MSPLKLRRIDPQAHAGVQAVQRWRDNHVDAGCGRPGGPSGYLRFRASGEGGEWRGVIDAQNWLHESLPGVQSLLAVECSLVSIAELFRAVPQPLLMKVDDLQYQQILDVDCLACEQLPPQDLPWLDTAQGRVWLTQLPPARAACTTLADHSWLSDLPLRLELKLGSSRWRCAHGLRLDVGDVLRIIQPSQTCCLGPRCLGVFTFTEQGLHMQSSEVDDQPQSTEKTEVDLGALPVRLEFVLATHEINLASLSQIIDGQLIPLADDAAINIEVRANGKAVARGELVQLDEQLGVELLEVYRNPRDE
ncbi:MAG: FliM/FliN family flagellar motor switch protein [Pseudomonas sp.]|uniref:FliM/FliN family flagellar motor switch protein n=1 Tax=Pseudomonas sp. TaxID=306 RepID=UPI003D6E7C52